MKLHLMSSLEWQNPVILWFAMRLTKYKFKKVIFFLTKAYGWVTKIETTRDGSDVTKVKQINADDPPYAVGTVHHQSLHSFHKWFTL